MNNMMKQQMARQFVDSEQFEAILSIFLECERETVEAVEELTDVVDGMDGIEEIPTVEDRQALIKEMAKAVIAGDFPSWYVKRLAPIDNAEEAAQFVGADVGDLVGRWADRLRDQDVEGDDRELATAYVRSRYGVEDLDEFRDLIEWDEEKVQETMENVVAGGFERAQTTAREAADIIDS